MRITIDGETVNLEPITDKNGEIEALKLVGPGTYNGHLHGGEGEAFYCIPNVVDSVARIGNERCPEVPEEFGPPYFASLWYNGAWPDAL